MDLSILQDVCEMHRGDASEYYIDPIPERKLNNARASLHISPSEQVVALIDFTIFGGAKDAMVVAESGLYWKQLGEEPTYLSWRKFGKCSLSENFNEGKKTIDFGNGLTMNLTGAVTLSKKDNPCALQLLTDLKEMAEGTELSDDQASMISEGLDSGLVECEFCKGRNKPEVTYCKHCGLMLRG